jgi:hypothetical protein
MAPPTYADIWKKLSVIDVSEFIKSRGIGSRTLSPRYSSVPLPRL